MKTKIRTKEEREEDFRKAREEIARIRGKAGEAIEEWQDKIKELE